MNAKKTQIQNEIKSLTDKISAITSQAANYPSQIAELNSQLSQLNKNLSYLRNQQPIFERVLNDAYVSGNSANDAVKAAKQNLDASAKRFADEQKIEDEATRNI